MTCPHCSHEADRFPVEVDELDGREVSVTADRVSVQVTISLSVLCPSCREVVDEGVAVRTIGLEPQWRSRAA